MRKLLLPFSWLYAILIWVRNHFYDACWLRSDNADLPLVVSIGNITVGGTGKTPVAAYQLKKYLAEGKKVAYLSRGYGRKTKGFLEVILANGNAEQFGDEAFMIKNQFPSIPVAVCEKRIEGARKLKEKYEIDVLILDDAFQHRQLYRDKDIVVIDAQRLPTNDNFLPAGNLRESITSLYRADEIIVNKVTPNQDIAKIRASLLPYISATTQLFFCTPSLVYGRKFANHQIQLPLSEIKTAIVFSGIGNNEFFLRQLEEKGIKVLKYLPFADHYYYKESDIEKLLIAYRELQPKAVLTTEKDYFRLLAYTQLQELPFYFVPMELLWLGGEKV